MARPEYQPNEADRQTVRSMAASGFVHEAIARCLGKDGIDDKTMRKHFRAELDTASPKANATIANVLYQRATMGEAWAVCFWLKCRAGWREVQQVEHSGPGGTAIDVNVSARDVLAGRIAGLAARIPVAPDNPES